MGTLKSSHQFLIQSVVTPKPIATRLYTLCQPHVFPISSDRLFGLPVPLM